MTALKIASSQGNRVIVQLLEAAENEVTKNEVVEQESPAVHDNIESQLKLDETTDTDHSPQNPSITNDP